MRPRHIVTTTLASLIAGIGSFLTIVVVAHVASTVETGRFSQFVIFFNIFYVLTNIGLAQSITYSLAARKRSYSEIRTLQAWFFTGLFGLTTALILLVALNTSAHIFTLLQIQPGILIVAMLTGAGYVALNIQQGSLYGLFRYDAVNTLSVVRALLPIPFIAIAALWFHTALIYAVVYLVAMLLVLIAAITWSRRKADVVTIATVFSGEFSNEKMVQYGGYVYGANMFHYLSIRGLAFLIGWYGTISEVGFFSIALLLTEGLLLIPNSVGRVVFPNSPDLDLRGRKARLIIKFSFMFGILATLGILLFGRLVITLILGARYLGVYQVMLWMVPALPLLSVAKVLSPIMSGKGAPQIPFAAAVVSFCVSATVGLLILPQKPLIGASVAIDAVALVTFVVMIMGYKRYCGMSLREIIIPSAGEIYKIMSSMRRILSRVL